MRDFALSVVHLATASSRIMFSELGGAFPVFLEMDSNAGERLEGR